MANGGRIPPDGRPPQAKGVGKNAKRHDLERPATPGLHGSDLQMGDVQALEQGQRVAPIQTQQPAGPPPAPRGGGTAAPVQTGAPVVPPDAIDFLGGLQVPGQFEPPANERQLDNSAAVTWLPLLRQMVAGPGSSGLLASLLINQSRALRRSATGPVTYIDLQGVDDGIEAMLDAGLSNLE